MNLSLFTKGLLVGLSIAAPVGPIGILCIRRSLRDGMGIGFATGLGAATADAAYGCVAGFGLTAVSGFLVGHRHGIGIIGGAFLCYLGARTAFSKPASDAAAERSGVRHLGAWGSTFLLTLGNPSTILSFVAVFAAFGLGNAVKLAAAAWLVLGVFLGSAAWWLTLSAAVSRLRAFMTLSIMRGINGFSGFVLFAFGLFAVLSR